MKKSSFILGLISGILGIISCFALIFIAITTTTLNHIGLILSFAILGVIGNIAGIVGACIVNNKSIQAGILMLLAIISNLLAIFISIPADSPVNFLVQIAIVIIFLIASIFAFISKKE